MCRSSICRQNSARVSLEPNASARTRTATPRRAAAARASTNVRPVASSFRMYASRRTSRSAAAIASHIEANAGGPSKNTVTALPAVQRRRVDPPEEHLELRIADPESQGLARDATRASA